MRKHILVSQPVEPALSKSAPLFLGNDDYRRWGRLTLAPFHDLPRNGLRSLFKPCKSVRERCGGFLEESSYSSIDWQQLRCQRVIAGLVG